MDIGGRVHNQLEQLQAKAQRFNAQRFELALSGMSSDAQLIYQLLPILFHYNLPTLPGFVSDEVPAGIDLYEASPEQLLLLKNHFGLAPPDELMHPLNEIMGIYSMGSTSSLGQSSDSDLDIWICHQNHLSPDSLEKLEAKYTLISAWAESKEVDLNFFLVSENHFENQKEIQITHDNAGSALHYLLLDEFYRTAVHLAGRPLLWPVYPIEFESSYAQHVERAIQEKKLTPEHWLDFGGFPSIPAEEYFGAALWQLYKGIDSPYKAVLKTISMEAYSAQYPNIDLLCLQAKRLFQQQEQYSYQLDPYYLMLQQSSRYLEKTGDTARLDLLRRCFYFKNYQRLQAEQARSISNWQHTVMANLLKNWGWDHAKIQHLQQRPEWKVDEVKIAQKELIDALMHSYRNLIQFARNSQISESINPEDIGILSRKLYAAFEKLPGKVTIINPQISPNLNEPALSFIQVPKDRPCAQGWYLYKYPLATESLIGRTHLEHSEYISQLMAWCYFNELKSAQTKLYLYNQNSDLIESTLNQFAHDIANTFPVSIKPASNLALSGPCEVNHLGVFINLERDPTNHWGGQIIEFDANASNVFSFGNERDCLIGSIDLIYRNSWNEIRTRHFDGERSVIDALTTILNKMHRDSKGPESIDVFCYSQHFRSLIRSRCQQLITECIEYRLHPAHKHAVKTLIIGQTKYGIFFEKRGVSVKKLEKGVDYYSHISANKLEQLPLRLDKSASHDIPPIVDAYASEGLVQFFFEEPAQQNKTINIYIVDENNRIEIYQHYSGNKDDLVQGVNRFYTSNKSKFNPVSNHPNFNLPQFYEIKEIKGVQQVLPYRTQAKPS